MKLSDNLDRLKDSLWTFPIAMTIGAIILSTALIAVDRWVGQELVDRSPLLFGGTPAGARDLLAVIASSMVGIVAVTFSVTIIAIQQASSQYSPRILRGFTRDTANKVVLGSYLGTFTFALLVMRQVREPTVEQDAFVPSLSVTTGVLLALVSLGMLVYFINHIALSIQVTTILASVRRELYNEIDHLYPERIGSGDLDMPSASEVAAQNRGQTAGEPNHITASRSGYIRTINEEEIEGVANKVKIFGRVHYRVGDFVRTGSVLMSIWPQGPDEQLTKHHRHLLQGAIIIDEERSVRQDALFGIRQIVDIALKASSPSANDPTTAEQCLNNLGEIIGRLQERSFPSPLRRMDPQSHIIFNRPDFASYIDVAFHQMIDTAKGDSHMLSQIRATIMDLISTSTIDSRRNTLRSLLDEVPEPPG